MSKKSNKKQKEQVPFVAKPAQKTRSIYKPKTTFEKKDLYFLMGALLLTFICFISVYNFQFVNWDDSFNFYENDLVTTMTGKTFWQNTVGIFTSTVIGNYNPLTIWTFGLENMIYGIGNPGAWHITNLLLHMVCVYLVYRVVRMLGLKAEGALLVALLFGIHPMRVESVAWVTERKDVLFGAFYLGAMIQYIKYQDSLNKRNLIFTYVLFVLSLFSKIQAVSLPLSLIAIDYLRSGEFTKKQILSKTGFFLGSLGFGLLGVFVLKDTGSLDSTVVTYPLWQRIFIGSYSLLIYLVKAVVPFEMSPLYPYPAKIPTWFYPTLLIFPLFFYGVWEAYKRNKKILVFGLTFFFVNVVFLLQILGAGQGYLADRFTYIPYLGLFFIAGYYLEQFLASRSAKMLWASVAIIIAAYSVLTFNQLQVWQNGGTLWTKVIKHYKQTPLPFSNRANYYRENGRIQEALRDYDSAIKLEEKASVYNSRARLFFDIAKTTDTLALALDDYNRAIHLDPSDGEFYANRGATYARLGMMNEAKIDMDQAIKLKPDHAAAYLNRSVFYNSQGNYEGAYGDIQSYLKLRPNSPDLWYESGRIQRAIGKPAEAIKDLDRAITLDRNKAIYYYERGLSKIQTNNVEAGKQDVIIAMQMGQQVDPSLKAQLGIQ